MHLHASALDFLVMVAYSIILGFLARIIAARYPDSAFGKALAFTLG